MIYPAANLALMDAELYQPQGSFEGQMEYLTLLQGNPRLIFAVCTAFAAPVAKLVNAESGGIHFWGKSAHGKSTAGTLANAIYRKPTYLTWRATDNGLMAIAAAHAHNFLYLDELHQGDPKTLPTSVYDLANEASKIRANTDGQFQQMKSWKLVYLSSGEQTLEGMCGKTQAGQHVRLAPIELQGKGDSND